MSLITNQREKRILVVDECKENLLLMQFILESQGYKVILAQNGKAALAEIVKTKLDLVILNMAIPNWQLERSFEVNNFGITCYLRTTPEFFHLPIVWLTEDRSLRFHPTLEINALIYKPFEIDELLSKIALLLGVKDNQQPKTFMKNTLSIDVEEQDPLRQQQAELEETLSKHHFQVFWDKLISEGYEIVINTTSFLAVS
ncbi:response regulator receiver [Stanieria cyanosphaera PCC 7437]|uniref:Response regulator receiver n=1 Tax=Stanieria cyanosphaera (strain ATCC 29371 / PCC 7437) TaxID=111780 RepID=K9XXD4_STAC7|nr:response regulator [Stanieria cyanosphaera]AFZ36719.1 response regulator receiver [Stanieria cyanosphaera PCC 7437]